MYGSELTRQAKSATDFATAADVEAEQAILDVICAARPDDGFVGEELGEVGSSPSGRTWLVDPLCGTLNFAAFTPLFSVNVALVETGATTVAAVAHPPSGEVYWADHRTFGILGREHGAPPNTLVNINADGPLDRPFVGAQSPTSTEHRSTPEPDSSQRQMPTRTLSWCGWSGATVHSRSALDIAPLPSGRGR